MYTSVGIAVANYNNVLTYIVADKVAGASKILTFDANGNLKGSTGNYSDVLGIGFINGKVIATQCTGAKVLMFGFNSNTQTVIEPPEKVINWGSQLYHVSTTNNFIYVASNGSGKVGKFDANLQNSPLEISLSFGPTGFATNYNETIGWATDGGSTGWVDEVNLSTLQTTRWPATVGQYAWQVVNYQNTLFFNARIPQELEWYKQDGTPLGSVSTIGYNPVGICIYYNPSTGKTEAAVTFWEGQIWIYEVQEITP